MRSRACTRARTQTHTHMRTRSATTVMTHDSIGLGEDGPTHQPIEQLSNFRAMPDILMVRPSGGNETAGAYKVRFGHSLK